jgi:transcriptional regulator with XRE-family HTH domain
MLPRMDYKALIAANLKRVIESRQPRSKNELSRIAGVSANTIKNILEKKVSPQWANLEKIARALRIAPHTLVIPEDEAVLLEAFQAASPEDRDFLLQSAALITRKAENQ